MNISELWLIDTRYLFNPLTVASCLGRPTVAFTNYAILLAISSAVQKKTSNAITALSIASYLSLYPTLLLPAILLLCHDTEKQGKGGTDIGFFRKYATLFAGSSAVLLLLSYLVTGGSWEFLSSTYGNHILLVDLTPNIGLWWYFFIEMFDSFREFFLGVFWLHLVSYTGGLCARIRKQPLFILVTMLGLFSVFIPYPSISNASLYLALFPLYRHVFSCKYFSILEFFGLHL
jgi:GPI-anchor transamidase subunit U